MVPQSNRREDLPKRSQPRPERGAPASHPAHVLRKSGKVRVMIVHSPQDSEDPPEQGYGHGV